MTANNKGADQNQIPRIYSMIYAFVVGVQQKEVLDDVAGNKNRSTFQKKNKHSNWITYQNWLIN